MNARTSVAITKFSRRKVFWIVPLLLLSPQLGCAMAKKVACTTCKGSGKCWVCGGSGKPGIALFSNQCGMCQGNGNCKECEGWGY